MGQPAVAGASDYVPALTHSNVLWTPRAMLPGCRSGPAGTLLADGVDDLVVLIADLARVHAKPNALKLIDRVDASPRSERAC